MGLPSTPPVPVLQVERSEVIRSNLNPIFAKVFMVDYYFEEVQKLRFEVYDIHGHTSIGTHDDDFLGGMECTVGQVRRGCGAGGDTRVAAAEKSCLPPGERAAAEKQLESHQEGLGGVHTPACFCSTPRAISLLSERQAGVPQGMVLPLPRSRQVIASNCQPSHLPTPHPLLSGVCVKW